MLNQKHSTHKQYAFFDVDETVIATKSMMSFMSLYFEQFEDSALQKQFEEEMQCLFAKDTDWKIINQRYYTYFSYFPISRVQQVCALWFEKHNTSANDFYHKNVVAQLKQHQQHGIECVFVSGSFRELLQPIADQLGVQHILSINLERSGLMYTGDIMPPQTIGSGKADAIFAFLQEKGALAQDCYAYGDDISDVPMLEIVGNPVAVTGGRRLEQYARQQDWQIINPN